MATLQSLQPLQNGQFGSKIKIHKNMRETTLQAHKKCSMEKKKRLDKKKPLYSEN